MKKKTFTIDETTEVYLRIINDATGASASEIIRRAVDLYYWEVKKSLPGLVQDAIEKYRFEQGLNPSNGAPLDD